jgi:hypothetical protein
VLDAEHVLFMSGDAISSAVAARDGANSPSVAKGLGVRVQDGSGTVEVFVDAERAVALLQDLRGGYPIALVCSEPMSHRTIQVKGQRAEIKQLTPGDETLVARKVDGVVAHLQAFGYREQVLRAYFAFTPATLTRIVFSATAAFLQTPGPGAGRPLKP